MLDKNGHFLMNIAIEGGLEGLGDLERRSATTASTNDEGRSGGEEKKNEHDGRMKHVSERWRRGKLSRKELIESTEWWWENHGTETTVPKKKLGVG